MFNNCIHKIGRVFIIVLSFLLFGACSDAWLPAPVPGTPEPIAAELDELQIRSGDLPEGWNPSGFYRDEDEWMIGGAVSSIKSEYTNKPRANLYVTIVRMADTEDSELNYRRSTPATIERKAGPLEATVLIPEEDIPSLHADQHIAKCEDYGWIEYCTVRMRYDKLYVDVSADFINERISVDEFLELVEIVDMKMEPIWSNSESD